VGVPAPTACPLSGCREAVLLFNCLAVSISRFLPQLAKSYSATCLPVGDFLLSQVLFGTTPAVRYAPLNQPRGWKRL
jgi:hypothetical protein